MIPVAATILCVASSLLWAATPALAQPTEWEVKAAFLPRFFRYVTWQPSAMPRGTSPFVLCVMGSDPFGASLDQAARNQTVDGRRIAVRRLDSDEGSDNCHVLFVAGGRTTPKQAATILAHRQILTVTDSRNNGPKGIIHFSIVGGRVRFFIDQSLAEQRGLSISSRLLALALGVRH
jgi:hypothetical protein